MNQEKQGKKRERHEKDSDAKRQKLQEKLEKLNKKVEAKKELLGEADFITEDDYYEYVVVQCHVCC